MQEINIEIYDKYYSDLYNLIKYFKRSNEKTIATLEKLRTYITEGSAFAAGHIIKGHLSTFIWCHKKKFSGIDRIHITYFIVSEEYRGEGLSRDLISYAKKVAQKNNINEIDLNVNPENKIAIDAYHRAGFTTEKLQLIMKIDEGESNV